MYIRPALPNDRMQLERLVEMLFPDREGEAAPGDRIWVAEQEGRIMGFVRISPMGNDWVLNGIGVLPGNQRNGIGTQLLERALHELRPADVHLEVEALNPAIEFYQRMGFVLRRFGTVQQLVRQPIN